MRHARFLPLFALVLLALIWGYTWVPLKIGLGYSTPFVFAALRTLPGGILLLLCAFALKRPLLPRPLLLLVLLGVLQTSGFTGFTMGALVSGGAGRTSILANTWQFWILLMAWPILHERVRGWQWLSVALCLVGLVLIIEPWNLHGVVSSLLALAGAVSFAASSMVAKILRRRAEIDLLTLTGWQTLFGSVPLVLLALLVQREMPQWTAAFGWSLAYTLVIGTCGGAFLWLYVLKRLPAGIAGLGTMGTPVVGLLLSWAQLGEQPTVFEALGMVGILVGLGILLWAGSRTVPAPPVPALGGALSGAQALSAPSPVGDASLALEEGRAPAGMEPGSSTAADS